MIYGFVVDKKSNISIARQMEQQIREAVRNGKFNAGTKMPPTRVLANELKVARNTIIQVYEQMIAEGYLESIGGSGTFVSKIGSLPDNKSKSLEIKTSEELRNKDVISFNAGNPDADAFPKYQWAKMLKEACLDADQDSIGYGTNAGAISLRRAISSYVYRVKGIQCSEEQIIIVPGASGGMDILAQTLFNAGGSIALEDPCIKFVRASFLKAGYKVYPVDVDSQGMQVEQLSHLPSVDLIYTVPSHQFPIGGVLPAARRITLLKYVMGRDAYIIEDDYDSEFRYNGEVIEPLRNLDPDRVIYLGSFSKIFTPALRMGYLIIPGQLKERMLKLMETSNVWVNTIEQIAMAKFINDNLLERHVYRMKKLYEEKRRHLISCLTNSFGDSIKITGENAGLHLLVSFNSGLKDRDMIELQKCRVEIDFVEDYACQKGKHRNQLVLGYGQLSLAQIEEGIRRMSVALRYQIIQ